MRSDFSLNIKVSVLNLKYKSWTKHPRRQSQEGTQLFVARRPRGCGNQPRRFQKQRRGAGAKYFCPRVSITLLKNASIRSLHELIQELCSSRSLQNGHRCGQASPPPPPKSFHLVPRAGTGGHGRSCHRKRRQGQEGNGPRDRAAAQKEGRDLRLLVHADHGEGQGWDGEGGEVAGLEGVACSTGIVSADAVVIDVVFNTLWLFGASPATLLTITL